MLHVSLTCNGTYLLRYLPTYKQVCNRSFLTDKSACVPALVISPLMIKDFREITRGYVSSNTTGIYSTTAMLITEWHCIVRKKARNVFNLQICTGWLAVTHQ
jgi:hypothetical protein